MDFLVRYQIEIASGVACVVALFIAALILDYLMSHNLVIRDQARRDAVQLAQKRAAARKNRLKDPVPVPARQRAGPLAEIENPPQLQVEDTRAASEERPHVSHIRPSSSSHRTGILNLS